MKKRGMNSSIHESQLKKWAQPEMNSKKIYYYTLILYVRLLKLYAYLLIIGFKSNLTLNKHAINII